MPKEIGGLIVETVGDILENGAATPPASDAVSQPGNDLPDSPAGDPAPIGHNGAPPDDPFEALKERMEDLIAESVNWLDGDDIATEGQAEEIGKLRDALRDIKSEADDARKVEKAPFDAGAAAVQAKYNPWIQPNRGRIDIALAACKTVLGKWLKKKDDELRAAAVEANKRAVEAAAAAQSAAMKAGSSGNVEEMQSAQEMLDNAKAIVKEAGQADRAKAQVAGSDGRRAIGMKSVWHADLTDPKEALLHYRTAQPAALKQWLRDQAQKDVNAGARSIPGITVREERVPS